MLSDLLKKYIGDAFKYFDTYSAFRIQLSVQAIENSFAEDRINWHLATKDDDVPLEVESVLTAIEKDFSMIGTIPGEKFRVVVDIDFLTSSGADAHYNDFLVITVGEDDSADSDSDKDDDKEDEDELFDEAESEEIRDAFLNAWKEAMENKLEMEKKLKESQKKTCKNKPRFSGSIISCRYFPGSDEDFF